MILRGECLACSLLGECTKTSAEKVRQSFTCASFDPAPEPVYLARWDMMVQFGEESAAQALVLRSPDDEEEERT